MPVPRESSLSDDSRARWAVRRQLLTLINDAGGRRRLIYLKAPPELLARRLSLRADRFDANAAFPITDEQLIGYIAAFEEPQGEGEEIILVADDHT